VLPESPALIPGRHTPITPATVSYDKAGELRLARAESVSVADAYVDGVLDVKDRLRKIVEIAR
jgi:hypothetical protein